MKKAISPRTAPTSRLASRLFGCNFASWANRCSLSAPDQRPRSR
jgi:hypothetical protein